jgi:putative FmdB family regulatory protein
MPLYTYKCKSCGAETDRILSLDAEQITCPECSKVAHRIISGAPSFKIKGFRAENQYGRAFIDTPGKDAEGNETGYSYTSNRADGLASKTIDHNQGNSEGE